MMSLLEKWLKKQKVKILKTYSPLNVELFYRKLEFIEISFGGDSIKGQYINLSKAL